MIEEEFDIDVSDLEDDDEPHLRPIRRGVTTGRPVDSEDKLVIKERKPQEPQERDPDDDRVFIGQMASILGRYEHTVRRWVRESEKIFVLAGFVPPNQGLMPQDLWPEREPDGRKRIWWKADQVDELKKFADMKESRRGWHGASRAS